MPGSTPPRHLLWTVPVVFLLHDLEEIFTTESWSATHAHALPERLRAFLPIPTREFTASVLLILGVLVLLAVLDGRRLRSGKPVLWTLLGAATLVANGLTHPLQALAFGTYTPGVVTAVLLVIPFGAWLLWTGLRDGWLTPRRAVQLVVLGMVLQAPIALAALVLGRALA